LREWEGRGGSLGHLGLIVTVENLSDQIFPTQ
jgi:hypothetical protein